MILTASNGIANQVQRAPVALASDACLTACRPGVPCTLCRTACPEAAIRIAERSVRIDPAACSGCGRCLAVCPTGAIEAPGFRPARSYDCARVRPGARGGDTVACLGGLSAGVLREALHAGDVTLMDRGWCATCPVSGGQAAPWAAAVDAVNAEAAMLGIAPRVHVRRKVLGQWRALAAPKAPATNAARRAILLRVVQAGSGGAAPSDPRACPPAKAATPGPRLRHAQLAALAGDQSPPAALFPALALLRDTADFGGLARLCPTTALAVTEHDDRETLTFDATACIGCGACTVTGALALVTADDTPLGGARVLATRPRATCSRCRMRFSPSNGETTCDGCARDTDLAALAHGLRRH